MKEILRAAPATFAVASYVEQNEAHWIYNGKDAEGNVLKQPIELQPLIAEGLLEIVEPDLNLLSGQMIFFAAHDIRNGEMISGAIAHHRNWAIGTDDNSAAKKFAYLVPHLQIVSTFDLVRHWAVVGKIPPNILRSTLQNIRDRGRFKIAKDHRHYDWVVNNV